MLIQNRLVDVDNLRASGADHLTCLVLCLARGEHFAELADQPAAKLDEAHLIHVVGEEGEGLAYGVGMEFGRCCDDRDDLRDILLMD